jgi:hypothetical protein
MAGNDHLAAFQVCGQDRPSGMIRARHLGPGQDGQRFLFFGKSRFALDLRGVDADFQGEQRELVLGKFIRLGSPAAQVEQANLFTLKFDDMRESRVFRLQAGISQTDFDGQ